MIIRDLSESKVKRTIFIKAAFALLFILCISFALVIHLKSTGIYPRGTDIYGHIYKANFLYESIRQGNLVPLFIENWYNGVQEFRYTGPVPYYILAGLQFITGDPMDAYLLFVGVSFAFGAIGWLLFGIRYNRVLFCTVLGTVWFLLPHNADIAFAEGNFPRMVIAVFLPYLFYFIWRLVEYKKYRSIFFVIIFTMLIALSHLMIAAMVGITTFIFTVIYSIANKKMRESAYVIAGMLISFAMIGIWVYPALKGGIMSMNNSSVVELSSEKISISLNPLSRLNGGIETFYFGLSIFVLSVFGVLLSDRKRIAGFLTPIIILFSTTPALVPIIVQLPMGEFLWMQRFTPMAYTVFFISLIEWKKCKKITSTVFCLLLILDTMTSLTYINIPSPNNTSTASQRQQNISDDYCLDYAKSITAQRLAFMDLSKSGSFPAYEIAAEEPETQYTFGWIWQGSATSSNIVMLNTSLEEGDFNYMFDRCIELGDDTVIVRKDALPLKKNIDDSLKTSASRLGYELYKQTDNVYVFHKATPATFGVVTKYEGLAIGTSAQQIPLLFPYFVTGKSTDIADYSFDELAKYKKIYLSGFTYGSKDEAEKLITKLTDNGVQVYIDMNNIPADSTTQRMNFMGVVAQNVSFDTQYPTLVYGQNIVNADIFVDEYNSWNTVFLDNVPNVTGYATFEGKDLAFSGTGENENLNFIGFNILYHAMETGDAEVLGIVRNIFGLNEDELPQRTLVPITVTYDANTIKIDSPVDNLNTTIAYQDIFRSKNTILENNNLLVVNSGKTKINFVYPYLTTGIIISAIGFMACALLIYLMFRYKKAKDKLSADL